MATADHDPHRDADGIALGRIGRAHGVKGAFRVWPYAENHERFRQLEQVTLRRNKRALTVTIDTVRLATGHIIVQTNELTSPEDIRPWVGGELEIDESERVPLPEGRYFHDQIIGLRVRATNGDTIGTLVRIIDGPANDVYVCSDGAREHLIPAVDEFVKSIDLDQGIMTIAVIPGLLTE